MLTNIASITQDIYMSALRHNIRTGGNLLCFGQAGVGKTEMAIQAAEAEKFAVYYLNLSVLEAPDLIGLPFIDDDKCVDYAPPKMLPVEGKVQEKVVLLVDELDKGKPEMQNPLLELFQSHTLNGRKMLIQSIVATGNLPDEGAHSQPVSHALTNRCKVFRLEHSFEPWREWAQSANVNALVVGFLSKNNEYLSQAPIEGDPTAYARCSPRSWTLAAKDLDTTSNQDSIDFQTLLVAGRVGQAAAVKFRVWLDHYRHVEPLIDKLVADGTHPQGEMTIDKQLVCAIGAVAAVAQECRKDGSDKAKREAQIHKTAKNVFSYLQRLPSEFQVAAVKSTLSMELITKWQLTKVQEVMNTYLNVRKAMK